MHWGSTVFAPDPGRRLIVLSPGETLSASVSFGYTSKYPLHAAYLEITPPGARPASYVPGRHCHNYFQLSEDPG